MWTSTSVLHLEAYIMHLNVKHAQFSPIVHFLFLIRFHVCFHCLMWRNGKLWNWILLAIANSDSVFGSLQGACWWLRARGDREPLNRAAGEATRGPARASAWLFFFFFSWSFSWSDAVRGKPHQCALYVKFVAALVLRSVKLFLWRLKGGKNAQKRFSWAAAVTQ